VALVDVTFNGLWQKLTFVGLIDELS